MKPKKNLQMFQMKTTSNGRRPQIEDYLNNQKRTISATTGWMLDVRNVSNEDNL